MRVTASSQGLYFLLKSIATNPLNIQFSFRPVISFERPRQILTRIPHQRPCFLKAPLSWTQPSEHHIFSLFHVSSKGLLSLLFKSLCLSISLLDAWLTASEQPAAERPPGASTSKPNQASVDSSKSVTLVSPVKLGGSKNQIKREKSGKGKREEIQVNRGGRERQEGRESKNVFYMCMILSKNNFIKLLLKKASENQPKGPTPHKHYVFPPHSTYLLFVYCLFLLLECFYMPMGLAAAWVAVSILENSQSVFVEQTVLHTQMLF